MNHFAKVCQAKKEKVHVAEEAEAEEYGYESEESLLKIDDGLLQIKVVENS